MKKLYYATKSYLTHFQLYYCCWFAPVRVGLFIIGFVNVACDLLYMVQVANDGLEPTILSVQNALIPDYVSKPVPVAAYAIEFAFNVVLLCGLYRRDITLLRVFLYYTIFAVVLSFMTYSMVLPAVALHIQLAIIFSTLFQMYCILLVRSEIVHMKAERKKYELPRLVMSTLSSPPSAYNYPRNGQYRQVTITEFPRQQDVQLAMIENGDRKTPKIIEIKDEPKASTQREVKEEPTVAWAKNDPKVKIETDENNVGTKNEIEVLVDIETNEHMEDGKPDVTVEKSFATKLSKEEKKKEEKRIKEEKKKEEKRIKEERKKEEKKRKEDNVDKEQLINEQKEGEEPGSSKETNKEIKEKWVKSVPENSVKN